MIGRLAVALLMCLILSGVAHSGPPARIVSLAPNMTEILFALGAGDRIVGVTTFCDYPAEARLKPRIGGMSNPSLEAVVRARPDLVLMTTDGNPEGVDRRLNDMGVRTYVSRVRSIYDLPDEIRGVARAVGAEGEGERLATRIERAIEQSRNPGPRGERVVFVIWPEPLVVAGSGTAVSEVIELLGYTNPAATTGVNYPRYSVEELLAAKPDYVLIGAGVGMGGAGGADIEGMSGRLIDRLRLTPAGRFGRVYYVGDSLYRLGPRIVGGIEELERVLGHGGGDE